MFRENGRDGDGFGPAGKAVDAGKEESLTVGGREGSDQIKVADGV